MTISITIGIGGKLEARFPYNKALVDSIKRVPGFEWTALSRAWIAVGPEVFLDLDRYGIHYSMDQRAQQERERLYELLHNIAVLKSQETTGQYEYQTIGAQVLALQGRGILADEMGLGKSKQSLDAAQLLDAKRILIIAPKSLLWNWERECSMWAAGYPVYVYDGTPKERAATEMHFHDAQVIIITNYEKLLLSSTRLERQWDVVIADEAQRAKNTTSKTHKALNRLCQHSSKHAFLLTGTPLEIRIEELYALTHIIRPAALGSYWRFRQDHLVLDGWGNVVGSRNVRLLQERVGAWITRRTKQQVLKQLPPKLPPVLVPVELGKQERDIYSDIKRGLLDWSKDGKHTAGETLVQLVRFQQLTSSLALLGFEGRGSKYNMLEDMLCGWQGERAIVFTRFREMADKLRQWLPGVLFHRDAWITGELSDARERQRRVDEFNAGRLGKVLVGTDAMAFGLSIQADLVVHYDKLWNPAKEWQREDRAHGVGRGIEGVPTTVVYLLADGTLDVGMHRVTEVRAKQFHDVLDDAETVMVERYTSKQLLKLVEGDVA